MLNEDYRDMLSAFEHAGVEYLLVGAYALAVHGHPRATGDIDLLTSIDAVAFDEAWENRMTVDVEGLRISVLSRTLLIQNKRATGRTQDLADVERLEGAS